MTPIDALLWILAILFAAITLAIIIVIAVGVARSLTPKPPKNNDHTVL